MVSQQTIAALALKQQEDWTSLDMGISRAPGGLAELSDDLQESSSQTFQIFFSEFVPRDSADYLLFEKVQARQSPVARWGVSQVKCSGALPRRRSNMPCTTTQHQLQFTIYPSPTKICWCWAVAEFRGGGIL